MENNTEATNLSANKSNQVAKYQQRFVCLLQKLGVTDQVKLDLLAKSVVDQQSYLDFCKDVENDVPSFTANDESILRILDNDHSIDCIRILAFSKRIRSGDENWLETFAECGGISVVVETIDNCLHATPLNVSGLFEMIKCLRHIISIVGLEPVTGTRGTVNAVLMSLDFKYSALSVGILELLNTICTCMDPKDQRHAQEIYSEICSGLMQLSHKLDQNAPPLTFLVHAIGSDNSCVRFQSLQFVNRLMMKLDLNDRYRMRLQLIRAGIRDAINCHRNDSTNIAINESSYVIKIDEDKCKISGHEIGVKPENVDGSEFAGVMDVLTCTLSLDHEELRLWVTDSGDDSFDFTAPPGVTIPVSAMKSVVEFSLDAELRACATYSLRIDFTSDLKLNFGFFEIEIRQAWFDALKSAILRKKLELSVWPNVSSLLDENKFYHSLWVTQVELHDLLYTSDEEEIRSLSGKGLINNSHAVIDSVFCRIDEEKDLSLKDSLIKLGAVIIKQFARINQTKLSAERLIDEEEKQAADAKIVELEAEVHRLNQLLLANVSGEALCDNTTTTTIPTSSTTEPVALEVCNDATAVTSTNANNDPIIDSLTPNLKEIFHKHRKSVKMGIPTVHVYQRMVVEEFAPDAIQHLFTSCGVDFAVPGAGLNRTGFAFIRKDYESPSGKEFVQLPVKKVDDSLAAESAVWTKIQEVDLDWIMICNAFATPIDLPSKKSSAVYIDGQQEGKPRQGEVVSKPAVTKKLFDRSCAPYSLLYHEIKAIDLTRLAASIVDFPTSLTGETAMMLVRNYPTHEQLQELSMCSNDERETNRIAQFYSILSSIPRCKERLRFLATVESLTSNLSAINRKLNEAIPKIRSGIDLLSKTREHFSIFLCYCLSICNYMNSSSSSAKAAALSLESLAKLGTTYSKVPGKTHLSVLHLIDDLMVQHGQPFYWNNCDWDGELLSLAMNGVKSIITNLNDLSIQSIHAEWQSCVAEVITCKSLGMEYSAEQLSPVEDQYHEMQANLKLWEELKDTIRALTVDYCMESNTLTEIFPAMKKLAEQCKTAHSHNDPKFVKTASILHTEEINAEKKKKQNSLDKSNKLSTESAEEQLRREMQKIRAVTALEEPESDDEGEDFDDDDY